MATGTLATLGQSQSLTYKPTSNARVTVVTLGAYAFTINGVGFPAITGGGYFVLGPVYVAAGQTFTFSTGANGAAIISTLES
jgi:hypothetical protein